MPLLGGKTCGGVSYATCSDVHKTVAQNIAAGVLTCRPGLSQKRNSVKGKRVQENRSAEKQVRAVHILD